MHWRDRTQRRSQINEPGHAHELTFTCFHRYQFLAKDRACQWLADEIDAARAKLNFQLWAYVFMPDHVHLVVWPEQPIYDVSLILKAIKGPVGRKAIAYFRNEAPEWLPRITVQRGKRSERHFWQQGGGFDRNVIEAKTLMAMIDYIHNNPVRKHLVTNPEEWKWSSAAWLLGREPNSLRPDPVPPEWGVVEVPGAKR